MSGEVFRITFVYFGGFKEKISAGKFSISIMHESFPLVIKFLSMCCIFLQLLTHHSYILNRKPLPIFIFVIEFFILNSEKLDRINIKICLPLRLFQRQIFRILI